MRYIISIALCAKVIFAQSQTIRQSLVTQGLDTLSLYQDGEFVKNFALYSNGGITPNARNLTFIAMYRALPTNTDSVEIHGTYTAIGGIRATLTIDKAPKQQGVSYVQNERSAVKKAETTTSKITKFDLDTADIALQVRKNFAVMTLLWGYDESFDRAVMRDLASRGLLNSCNFQGQYFCSDRSNPMFISQKRFQDGNCVVMVAKELKLETVTIRLNHFYDGRQYYGISGVYRATNISVYSPNQNLLDTIYGSRLLAGGTIDFGSNGGVPEGSCFRGSHILQGGGAFALPDAGAYSVVINTTQAQPVVPKTQSSVIQNNTEQEKTVKPQIDIENPQKLSQSKSEDVLPPTVQVKLQVTETIGKALSRVACVITFVNSNTQEETSLPQTYTDSNGYATILVDEKYKEEAYYFYVTFSQYPSQFKEPKATNTEYKRYGKSAFFLGKLPNDFVANFSSQPKK